MASAGGNAAADRRTGTLAGRGHVNRTLSGGKAVTRRKRTLPDRHAEAPVRSASRRYPSCRRGSTWAEFTAPPMPTTPALKNRLAAGFHQNARNRFKGGKQETNGTA